MTFTAPTPASAPVSVLPYAERRRTPRFSLASLALVIGEDGRTGHCTVEDLSLGGALLTGSMQLVVGEAIRVVLPLPGRQPASLVGRVVRRRPLTQTSLLPDVQQAAFGVMFNGASAQAAAQVHAALPSLQAMAALAKLAPAALVVDASVEACRPTVAALSAGGHAAVAVTNAFDALVWLGSGSQFAALVVRPGPAMVEGAALLRYVAEAHPEMRRVAIYDVATATRGVAQLAVPGALRLADVGRVFSAR